jgi:Cu+-exporting ATPase
MKNLLLNLAVLLLLFSCGEIKKDASDVKADVQTSNIAAIYKNLEVGIEGMTCEIGCARTIQSKLSKVEGISFAKVSFEGKKGRFTYDSNKISKEEITAKITGIGGGDLYAVSTVKELEKISD